MKRLYYVILILSVIVFFSGYRIYKKQAERRICMRNLKELSEAKNKFAAEYGAGWGAEITLRTLESFSNRKFQCPSGGKYEVNPVGEEVSCSIHGKLMQ